MDRQQQVLTWTSAFLLGISLGRWIGTYRDRKRGSNKLNTEVEKSSLLIAAWRAVENIDMDTGKLFTDKLAAALAGQHSFTRALSKAKPIDPSAQGPPGKRLYKISYVAQRTWWFDRQIMSALTSAAVTSKGWLSARLRGSLSTRGPSKPPRQVVILGSGMDTRPWRLAVPPGTRWFEIDRPSVLSAKREALQSAGAQLSDDIISTGFASHPLRCETWITVAADVTSDRWVDALRDKDFDPSQPTIWIAEGLLMYLTQDQLDALLRQLKSCSAAGSTLIGHALTDEVVEKIRMDGDAVHQYQKGIFPLSLIKEWKSSIPLDPGEFLESYGWTLMLTSTKAANAKLICHGDTDGKCDFDTEEGKETDREVIYFVAKTDPYW